eukprot:evm.model.scf_1083.1 EVM.evm.TU.scf_1083.1   scf_1083:16746-22125(+)
MAAPAWTRLCALLLVALAHRAASQTPVLDCIAAGGDPARAIQGDCTVDIGGAPNVVAVGDGVSTVTVNPDGTYSYGDDYFDYDDGPTVGNNPPGFVDPVPTNAPVAPVGASFANAFAPDADSVAVPAPPGPDGRPAGVWEIVVDGVVDMTPQEVWESTRTYGNFLTYGLGELAFSVLAQDDEHKEWVVELNSGEQLVFEDVETDEDLLFHVATLVEHGNDVFPGTDIRGSRIFFRAIDGDTEGTTQLEVGWGGPIATGGNSRDTAVVVVRSLLLEMITRLEDHFGQNCRFSKEDRTIEARCNNLKNPTWGAANQPLLRLEKHDPAFPDGKSEPSGPKDVSPRLISNKLFAQSPGADLLEGRLNEEVNECLKATNKGLTWEVCPHQQAKAKRGRETVHTLSWVGTETTKEKMILMKFGGEQEGCVLNLVYACAGEADIDFGGQACGSTNNWFFHPSACIVQPGSDNVLTNSLQMTDLFWAWGQFVDHDLDLTPTIAELGKEAQPGFKNSRRTGPEDEFPIEIPREDFFFTNATMEFERAVFSSDPDQVSHINQHSAFADLGQLYGNDFLRANALRSFVDGKLKMGPDDLLPLNKVDGDDALGAKVDNAPNATDRFYAAGDVRANEQPLLLSLHTIWAREHNLICDELKEAFPEMDDEELYKSAQSICISEYQSILWAEWLPFLLGEGEVSPDDYSYHRKVDATITAVFSTVAFRFGHSLVGSYLWAQGPGPRGDADLQLIPLRETFFNPELVVETGPEAFLRGGAWHLAQELDAKVVDELRNFLFTESSDEAHLDLVALNIQRGRDMGIPSFNQLRDAYDLKMYKEFSEINPDESVWHVLEDVYDGDIDKVDAFAGGMAEAHHDGAMLGETFFTIIKDQFTRMRDGDRFFYKGIQWSNRMLSGYPRIEAIVADEVRLADILERTTGITLHELGVPPRDTAFQL